MTAPALTVYVTGQGTVGGDQLNTFVSSCDTLADLRAFVGTTGIQVFTRGGSAPNDGNQGFFYWDPNAVGPDNNSTIIIPPAAASGGWVRLVENTAGFFYAQDTGAVNALAVTLQEDLASIQIGSVIFVNPAHTTTSTTPTLTINTGTPVTITSPLGVALAVGAITLGNPAQIMVGTGHALWLLNPGGSSLGPYATAAIGQLPGTTTNDNATAGNIGEFMSSGVGPTVVLTSTVTANITQITLTPGDWDVWGTIQFSPAPTTTFDTMTAGVSAASAAFGSIGSYQSLAGAFTAGGTQAINTGMARQSVAVNTIVYLVANSDFTTSTMNAGGSIFARRVR